jgi:hypothetical protein
MGVNRVDGSALYAAQQPTVLSVVLILKRGNSDDGIGDSLTARESLPLK